MKMHRSWLHAALTAYAVAALGVASAAAIGAFHSALLLPGSVAEVVWRSGVAAAAVGGVVGMICSWIALIKGRAEEWRR